ncbi:hypothetical protein FS749_009061, partial [Ceratobasidium sp. UAMH 11750]
MAGKIKQRFKRGINRIKGLFDGSPSGSQPPAPSTQLAPTPLISTPNPQPTPDAPIQPVVPLDATVLALEPRDEDQLPIAAPMPPASSAAGPGAGTGADTLDQFKVPPAKAPPNLQLDGESQSPPAAPIPPAAPATNQNAKHEGWAELKAFAGLLTKGAGMFGPLKQAVDGILTSVETFEVAAENRKEYQALKLELNMLFHDLAGYFGSSTPPVMTSSIVNLALGIERELELVRQERQRSEVGRLISAREDGGEILQCYRRIQGLLSRLT